MAYQHIKEPGEGFELSEGEADLVVWLHDNAHMPRVSSAIAFGEMKPLIARLRNELKKKRGY